MTDPSDVRRAKTLEDVVPLLAGMQSLLHVGEQMREGWEFWPDWFKAHGIEAFDCLEIYGPNVEALRAMPRWRRVYRADVRQVALLDAPEQADIVFWWHGPEHVPTLDFEPAIDGLIHAFTPKLIILGVPWGPHRNWEHKFKNPASYHRSIWYPADLTARGYGLATDGVESCGHISAWRTVGGCGE